MATIGWTTFSFILVSFPSLVSRGVAQDQSTITCEAPSQPEGSQATLTCDFKNNINTSSVWIVFFYRWDLYEAPSPVYDHEHSQTHSSPYQLLGTVDINSSIRQITFNASRQTTGYYTCELQHNKGLHPESCIFNISYANEAGSINGTVATGLPVTASSKHADGAGANIYIIVGTLAAALAIVAIVLIVVVICRHRQEKKRVTSTGNCTDQQDTSVVEMQMEQTPDQFPDYDSGIQLSAIGNHGYIQESKATEDFTSVDFKSTPNKASAGIILKPFLDMIEEQWKLVQAKKSSEKHNKENDPSEEESLAGSDEINYISNTDHERINGKIPERTPLCQREIKPARESDTDGMCAIYTAAPPKQRDWPPSKDTQRQSRWIVNTLMPYVGNPVFPTHTEEAKSQLADLLEVQTMIECRLDELKIYEYESSSVDMAQLKESVIVKLRTAQKMADIRYSAIKTLLTCLVKTEQRVKSAVDELSSLMGDSH